MTDRRRRRASAAALIGLGALATACGAEPPAPEPIGEASQPIKVPCRLEQVTDTAQAASSNAVLSGDGRKLAFLSGANIGGGNGDLNTELFLLDRDFGRFTQITHTQNTPEWGRPALDAHGTRVAFSSNADLVGENGDLNEELYLYDVLSSSLTQLTHTSFPSSSVAPAFGGDFIVFASTADLTGGNADGSEEIFAYDRGADTLTQLTDGPAGVSSYLPSIDAAGTFVTFISNGSFGGLNPGGSRALFTESLASPGAVDLLVGGYGGDVRSARMSPDGRGIAIVSTGNPFGNNADNNTEVFRYDLDTSALSQVTRTVSSSNGDASLSDGERRIAFTSSANITGEASFGANEVVLQDVATGTFTQVTNDPTGSHDSFADSMSADGALVAYESAADPLGTNADHNQEIFLAHCGSADLSATVTGPAVALAGASLTYTIAFANQGPDWSGPITVTDHLPPGTPGISVAASGLNVCSFDNARGVVRCNGGSIGPFSTGTMRITYPAGLRLPNGTVLDNSATVAGDVIDPVPANDTGDAKTTLQNQSDLSVLVSAASNVKSGGSLTYTLTVQNAGPLTAPSVTLSNAIPTGTTFVSADGGAACSAPTPGSGGVLTCNVTGLASGSSATFHLTVKVVARRGSITDTATVSGSNVDPVATNNSASFVTRIGTR